MAILFDQADGFQYYSIAENIINQDTFSWHCLLAWDISDDVTDGTYLYHGSNTNHNNFNAARADLSTGRVDTISRQGNGENQAQAPTQLLPNLTWFSYFGEFASLSSRSAWIDNDAGEENTVTVSSINSTIDVFGIGKQLDSSEEDPFNGGLCEVAVWSMSDSTTDEREMLKNRYSALFVRPQSLIAYWRLMDTDDTRDLIQGRNLTQNNTPVTMDHPQIIMPEAPSWHFAPQPVPLSTGDYFPAGHSTSMGIR